MSNMKDLAQLQLEIFMEIIFYQQTNDISFKKLIVSDLDKIEDTYGTDGLKDLILKIIEASM